MSNLPATEMPFRKVTSATAEASSESCTGVAPSTVLVIDGLAYGFCYDDVRGHSSLLEHPAPRSLTVTVG